MTADKRRGGPLATDRPNVADTAKSQRAESTAGTFPKRGTMHVLAIATPVVSAAGVERVLLVYTCLKCSAKHQAIGRGELPATISRRGPHGGLIVMHVVTSASSRAVAA